MKLVIAIYSDFPLWNFPGEKVRDVERASSGGTVVHLKDEGNLTRELSDADIAFAWRVPRESFASARNLKWIHCSGAGVTGLLFKELVESDCIVTNSKGIQAIPISEHVFSLMLAYSRKINRALPAQLEGRWARIELWTQPPELGEIFGKTIGIIGFGGIGKEVARRAKAFGMRVLAVRRNPGADTRGSHQIEPFQTIGRADLRGGSFPGADLQRDPSSGLGAGSDDKSNRDAASRVTRQELNVDAGGKHAPQEEKLLADEIHGIDSLKDVLAQSDYIVVSIPHTAETRGLFGEGEFRSMKRGAFFINVSRGAAVKEEALISALKKGWIGGAGLDVFEKEPLPEGNELYRLPNVILTPHVAGASTFYWERVTALFLENLRRFIDGKPLLNLVDKRAGY